MDKGSLRTMSSPETPAFEHRSVARVVTDRPARYGRQLTSHMGRKITTTWDEASSTGSLSFKLALRDNHSPIRYRLNQWR